MEGAGAQLKRLISCLAKAKLPDRVEKAKILAIQRLMELVKEVRAARTLEQLDSLMNEDPLHYSVRNKLNWSTPELNLYKEKELLLQLKSDERKTIPLSSEHELWGMLMEKCEPERA